MRWRSRQTQNVGAAELLADEAQRFLTGGYLEIAFVRDRDIPAWIWLSALAHGDADQLESLERWVDSSRGTRPEFDTWERVLHLLARKIRSLTEASQCSLETIQRELLIPLELSLMIAPIGPATLLRVVTSLLDHTRTNLEQEQQHRS